jgi:GR25 family glycosyltransferase involved in LPS biosynthesis
MQETINCLSEAWGFFDKVYCISLDFRIDRREQAKKQFARVGLLERVEFIIVKKNQANCEQGIFESHMLCLEKGLAAGAQHILVLEDDVIFANFNPQFLLEACSALKSLGHWHGLFLGCLTSGSRKTGYKSLAGIKYRCLAHAYALNAPFARGIVREKWLGIPFDELLRRKGSLFFAIRPMCAFQGLSGTDNQTVYIDRMRRFFGGLPFIQRVNEVFQNHKALFLSLHLLIVLALAALVGKFW